MVPDAFCPDSAGKAGTLVRFKVKLKDMNVAVPMDDGRAMKVLASGLPMQHGAHLAIDTTERSATAHATA